MREKLGEKVERKIVRTIIQIKNVMLDIGKFKLQNNNNNNNCNSDNNNNDSSATPYIPFLTLRLFMILIIITIIIHIFVNNVIFLSILFTLWL